MECPKCGKTMLLWQAGLIYRDCDDLDKIQWRCVRCGYLLNRFKGDSAQKPTVRSQAYREGARAGLDRDTPEPSPPYSKESQEWHDWIAGYDRGITLSIAEMQDIPEMTAEEFDRILGLE